MKVIETAIKVSQDPTIKINRETKREGASSPENNCIAERKKRVDYKE